MAQRANLISQDDMITRGRIWLYGRLSESEVVSLLTAPYCFLIKERKGENEGKRIKGDP